MKRLPDSILALIEECKKKPHPKSELIALLHRIQNHFGYLPKDALEELSHLMQIPSAKITGVASFYHYFRLEARGRCPISICMGTACYVKGAEQLAARLKKELNIDWGETTKDGFFTLERARCLGMCALAPVIQIGDKIYPKVTSDQIPSLLESCTEKKESDH